MALGRSYPIVALGQIAVGYVDTPEAGALTDAERRTLAALVANKEDGITLGTFAEWSSRPPTLVALRTSIYRLKLHLRPGAIARSVHGRYRLTVPSEDVDLWHLRDLVAATTTPDRLDVGALRHLLRPVEPYGAFTQEDVLRPAVEEARLLQRDLMARLAPDVLGGEFVDELLAHLNDDPVDERLVLLCASTLARTGRRADALNVIARARREFSARGLAVGRQLDELDGRLLDGDVVVDVGELVPRTQGPGLPRALAEHLGSPLVGPTGTVDGLNAFVHALGGDVRGVVVQGPSGVGKTRLCAELAALARSAGARVVYAPATREGAAALGPLLAGLPSLRERVSHVFDNHDDPESRRAALWTACWHAMAEASAGAPLVLVVDDAQWLDSYTAEFLLHAISNAAPAGLLLVVVGRDDEEESTGWRDLANALVGRGAEEVAVDPLDEPSMRQLVHVRRPGLHETDVADVAEDVHALSDGLPGIAIPLIETLDEESPALAPELHLHGRRALEAAVRQLPPDARAVGVVGSIVGPTFDLEVVKAMSGLPSGRVVAALDVLLRRKLVVDRSVTEFAVSHVTVQAAFIATEPRARVAMLHRAAAERFSGDVHRHAFHAAEALPFVPPGDAASSMVQSAREHLRTGDYRAAAAGFARAARLCGELAPRDAGGYARALDLSGFSDVARTIRQDAFDRALAAEDWSAAVGIATSGLPEAEPVDGDPVMVANLERIGADRLADPADRWAYTHHLARQLAIVGRLDEAEDAAALLPAMAQTAEQVVDAAACRRFVVSATAPPPRRLAILGEAADAIALVDPARAAGYRIVRAIDHYENGEVDEALVQVRSIDRIADEVPVWRRWHARLFEAMVATDRGAMDRARTARHAALELAARAGLAEGENAFLAAEFVDLWLRDRADVLRPEVDKGLLDPERSVLMRAGVAITLEATGDMGAAVEHATKVVTSVAESPVSQGTAAVALVSDVVARSDDPSTIDVARTLLAARGESMIVIGAGAACLGPLARYVATLDPRPAAKLELLHAARSLADRARLPLWQVVTRRSLFALTGDRADLEGIGHLLDGTQLGDLAPDVT